MPIIFATYLTTNYLRCSKFFIMAKDKTTLRFWLRTDRINADGTAPIHLIYQIQGQRKYYAIPGTKLFPVNWSADEQQAIHVDKKVAKKIVPEIDYSQLLTSSEVDEVNAKLEQLKTDVKDVEKRFKLDKIPFSAKMVIDTLKDLKQPETKKELPGINIVDFIHRFIDDSTGTHKSGTLKVYYGLAAHLEEFEKSRNIKVTFSNLDIPMIRNFHGFLSEVKYFTSSKGKTYERSMNNITAAKQISTLKTILNYARVLYKIEVNQDYRDFKSGRKDSDLEVITLTQDEFDAIYNLDLSENKKLDPVRDVFCFSCATGLRYSDLSQLRKVHIKKDCIRMTAAKTNQKLTIPLNPISYAILQKYAERHLPLPIISNQKTNDYIKEIGELAGIDSPVEKVRMQGIKKITKVYKKYELLSIHVGRKTFITLSLEKGAAIQEVMAFSGHASFKSVKRYVDVNENRKKTVMAATWGELPNPLKVAN